MYETTFHLIFIFTFVAFTAIRAYYHRQATHDAGKVEYKEGWLLKVFRLGVGLPWIASLIAYLFQPAWFAWAHLELPGGLRWAGTVLGLASLPLIWWVQRSLGANFSTTLHVREEHTLVTSGPYHWVRHPMYSALFIWIVGLLLLSANWLIIGVPFAAFLLIVVFRIDNEEKTMIEKFGDPYRMYMQRTGRFLPRIGSRASAQLKGQA
jgi:protein-S-isoprenylcysteine O-methyltransferase Ste14